MSSAEENVRDYLRSRPEVMGLLNNDPKRLNMEWSGDFRATHVTLYRAGGSSHWYVPLDYPLISLHCHGTTRPVAADLADAIAAAIRDIDLRHAPLQAASVEAINYLPTSPDGTPRYVVTTAVTTLTGPVAA